MAKKIKRSDLIQGSLFGEDIKEARELIDLLQSLVKTLSKVGSSIKKDVLDINEKTTKGQEELNEKTTKAIQLAQQRTEADKKSAELKKQVIKLEEENIRLSQRLVSGGTEQAKSNEQLKVQIQLLNKERKEAAKNSLGLIDAYQKESIKLNELRKSTKATIIEMRRMGKSEKEISKATKEAAKEINELDEELKDLDSSLGQSQRKVGEYDKAIESAGDSLLQFATGAAAAKLSIDGLSSSIEATEEGSKSLEKAKGRLDAIGDASSQTIGTFFNETFDLVGDAFSDAADIIENKGISGFLSEAVDDLTSEKGLKGVGEDLGGAFEETAESIGTFAERVSNSIKASDLAIESQRTLTISQRAYREEIERLNAEIEKQNALAGDNTRSFDQIEEAANKAQRATVLRSALEIKANKEELAILEQRRAAKIGISQDAIKELAQIDERIKANVIDNKLSAEELSILERTRKELVNLSNTREIDNEISEKKIELIGLESALIVEQIELNKLLRENQRDRFELELDFAIDTFDTIKTINERRAADETLSLEKRRQITEETEALAQKSFDNQIKLTEDFLGQKVNLDELVKESDEEVIRTQLKKVVSDEITLIRILEIIRERKIANQDLIDSNKELADSERENYEILDDIILQEKELEKLKGAKTQEDITAIDEDLAKERQQNRIKAIDEELKAVEAGSIEEARLNQEKNDILLDQDRDAAEQRVSDKEKEQAELLELQKSFISALKNLNDKQTERELERIDAEVQAREENIDRLTEGLKNNVKFSKESIAIERKRLQELEAERKKVEERQARRELLLTGIELLATNEGDLAKTGIQLLGLRELVNSIPLFKEGTENTGEGGNLDADGGFLAILHRKERVMDEANNARMGGVSNEQAADIVEGHLNGTLYNMQPINGVKETYDFGRLERKLDELPSKMPQNSLSFNPLTKALVERIKVGNKITNNHNKKDGLWT